MAHKSSPDYFYSAISLNRTLDLFYVLFFVHEFNKLFNQWMESVDWKYSCWRKIGLTINRNHVHKFCTHILAWVWVGLSFWGIGLFGFFWVLLTDPTLTQTQGKTWLHMSGHVSENKSFDIITNARNIFWKKMYSSNNWMLWNKKLKRFIALMRFSPWCHRVSAENREVLWYFHPFHRLRFHRQVFYCIFVGPLQLPCLLVTWISIPFVASGNWFHFLDRQQNLA